MINEQKNKTEKIDESVDCEVAPQIQKEIIIKKLKESGCRITKQRYMLLDIILKQNCASCKEIYYEAVKQYADIGVSTVYRMINTLEEIGAINRRNMYKIAY